MRILFLIKQKGLIRHLDVVIKELADRDHVVRVACPDGDRPLPESLQGYPHVSEVTCPKKRGDEWRQHASILRRARDYLRYLETPYEGATKLRARAFEKFANTLTGERAPVKSGLSEAALELPGAVRTRLSESFISFEALLPGDPDIEQFVQNEAPDAILVSPLVDLGSAQTEYIKVAQDLGIPVGMVLFSWDNLSTKGVMHVLPDAVFIWNERQRVEARELHGVPDDRLFVGGAPRFDEFFELGPATSRNEFADLLGFNPHVPVITYLGSSKFVSDDERNFIETWVDRIRSAELNSLRDANILIKVHPDLKRDWHPGEIERLDWRGHGRADVSRPFGKSSVAAVRAPFGASQILFDCLYHSAAVIGLNTSAELEAGILGKAVLTIHASDGVADGQASTLHFHYLLESAGGFVRVARDLEEHIHQLSQVVMQREDQGVVHDFIREFLRPAGINIRATTVLVDQIEQFFGQGTALRNRGEGKNKPKRNKPARRDMSTLSPQNAGGERVLLDYEPVSIWLWVTSDAERRWRARPCSKEPFTVAWLENSLKPGDVFYDIGANVGSFSLIAARSLRNEVTVVAFEPGYASFARLCDNIVLNECDHCIIPIPLPLSSVNRMVGLRYRTLQPGQSRHWFQDELRATERKGRISNRYRQPVMAMRLDDMITQFELPLPTHIKLDVDGAEIEVLSGATATLMAESLETLMVELDPNLDAQIVALLSSRGFELSERFEGRKSNAPSYGMFRRVATATTLESDPDTAGSRQHETNR